jgi:hypothetical protein
MTRHRLDDDAWEMVSARDEATRDAAGFVKG